MSPLKLLSPPKINLTLDILGKDHQVGKHFLNTFYYRDDSWGDELVLEKTGSAENQLICDHPDVPLDASNTIHKALELLGEKGWTITLTKNIPAQAGLGGGSSNAGVILRELGRLKQIPEHLLLEMGKQIGADVPFFVLEDNLAYAEGFGDQIMQSWRIHPLPIAYHDAGIKVSTAEAYASLDLSQCGLKTAQTEALLQQIQQGAVINQELIAPLVHNDFEAGFFSRYGEAVGQSYLCGSGGHLWNWAPSPP